MQRKPFSNVFVGVWLFFLIPTAIGFFMHVSEMTFEVDKLMLKSASLLYYGIGLLTAYAYFMKWRYAWYGIIPLSLWIIFVCTPLAIGIFYSQMLSNSHDIVVGFIASLLLILVSVGPDILCFIMLLWFIWQRQRSNTNTSSISMQG